MDISMCLRDALSIIRIPEAIAVTTGILSVWFAKKESIWVYPVGLVSVLLYIYICLTVNLYADAAIQAYYAVVSIYGWYYWVTGGKHKKDVTPEAHVAISQLSIRQQIVAILLTLLLGLILSAILIRFTDSTVPLLDGLTTAIFCTAMVLMARKYIENWLYWIVGDILCVPLFFSKGLCLSSLQYGIFTLLAIAGWMAWRKKLRMNAYA